MYSNRSKGFTLIELLVVIAIIGILSTLAIIALGSARQKSRDAKRLADVNQVIKALELYYNDANSYPTIITSGQPISFGSTTYLSAVPSNPVPRNEGNCPNKDYQYGYAPTLSVQYSLSYCLSSATGSVPGSGIMTATPDGMSDNPLLYLPMDEGTGTSTADRSGNGYNATLVGSPSWIAGKVGGGLDFGSTGEYLTVPTFPIDSSTNVISFAAWVYADGVGLESLIGDASQGSSSGYIWSYLNGTNVIWQYRHSSGNGTDWETNSGFLTGFTNTWVHLVLVADYNAKQLKVYRNGQLAAVDTITNTPIFPAVSRPRYIASYNTSPDYNGRLDDVRLYARALSASEVQALYNATN